MMPLADIEDNARRGMRGFSLIEVLIAIFVFSVGALAVLQMVLGSFRVNDHSRNIDGATNAARIKMDELLQVPYNSAVLDPVHPLADRTGDSLAGLGAASDATADHFDDVDRYRVYWNLAHNRPVNDTLTLAVIATWDDDLGEGRKVVYQTVRVREASP